MKTIAAAFVLFASLSSAYAALPPTAESLRTIRAIAESKEVFDALGSASWVSGIAAIGDGTYTVTARDCALTVKVAPVATVPPRMVPELKVTVAQVNCLP